MLIVFHLKNSQGKKQPSGTAGTLMKNMSVLGREAKLNAIVEQINSNHECAKHKVADYVRLDGSHERFTLAQISQWAELIVSNIEID